MNPSHRTREKNKSFPPKVFLERALSKMGYCSRSQARLLIQSGKVYVNARLIENPEHPIVFQQDQITVKGDSLKTQEKVYLLLNKPHGFVTTTSDEHGKKTVYDCLKTFAGETPLPWVFPVGRLDKASEGVLLFSNDTQWANKITDPESHLDKTYHVQINCLPSENLLNQMKNGVNYESEILRVKEVNCLRYGQKNSWLKIILEEGKNRHIRRLLEDLDIQVLRLIRVAIGPLELGNLPKGQYRFLTLQEHRSLVTKKDSEQA